mmetsp:Transcript_3209/g.6283  ORF Transcript_3209/g.6283 Transcript_3209/m.6283 type:complete len:295 (-) Transcript_3209:42-926(-)
MGVLVDAVPTAACSSVERRLPPLLVAVATLLREIVRVPSVYWLMLTRQRAELATFLPLLGLPETMHASIISWSGAHTALRLSLTCRLVHTHLWENPVFWRSLLQLIGLRGMEQRCGGSFFEAAPLANAQALRAMARRRLLGIDLLISVPVEPSSNRIVARTASEDGRCISLKEARRAVLALLPEDGPMLIQRATDSISALLRSRAPGASECRDSEALLEVVSTQYALFSTGQMLDMLGAHQQASDGDLSCSTRMSRRASTRRRSGASGASSRCRAGFHGSQLEPMHGLNELQAA